MTKTQTTAPSTKADVVCAGDSLTQGTISANYISLLQRRFPQLSFYNAGVNGDTSAGLLKRIDQILLPDAAHVSLLIGTNDIHKSLSLEEYRANLEAILARLKDRHVALLSVPPLGEQRHSDINLRVEKWNGVIRDLAAEHGCTYLPLFELIAAQLSDVGRPFKVRMGLMMAAAFRHRILGQSFDRIAAANGFSILTDQIHLSDRGALIIADLLSEWLGGARSREEQTVHLGTV